MEDPVPIASSKNDSSVPVKQQEGYAKDFDTYYKLFFNKEEISSTKVELKDAVEKAIAEDLETAKDDVDSEANSQIEEPTIKTQNEQSNESTTLATTTKITELDERRQQSIFDKLPDEALLKIWNYLDPSSIGRIARVCKRFREMSYDLPLWRELSKKREWDLGTRRSTSQNLKNQTRSFYVRKFLSFRRGEKLKEEQKIAERKNRFKQKNRENSARFLKATCFARPWEWISVGCVLSVTILAVLKLDGSLNASWATVMIPLYILLLQVVGAPILYDTLSTCYDYDFDREFEPDDNSRCGPLFFFLAFIVPLQEATRFARLVIYPVITCLLLWLIMMFLKINHVAPNLPWIAAFIPLLIICLIFCIVILFIGTYNVFSDEQRMDRIIPTFFILLLIIFLIFLALKLEGTIAWSWFYVMTPLWILKGLFVLIPIILTMMTIICDRCINVYWLEDRTRWAEDPGPFCMTATGFIVLVLAPLLAFEILLAQNLEDTVTRTYKIIFIPLFILEGFGMVGCCIVNIAFLCSD